MSEPDKKFAQYGRWASQLKEAHDNGDAEAARVILQTKEFQQFICAEAMTQAKQMTSVRSPELLLGQMLVNEKILDGLLLLASTERKRLEHRITELEARFGTLQQRSLDYKGVWTEESVPYRVGELVTCRGGLWYCWRVTTDKPGTSDAWQLTSKTHGRDSE